MLISVCGIDGSGKTTQVKLLKTQLEQFSNKVIICKQHTDAYYKDERYRDYLNGALHRNTLTDSEMILFSSYDRQKHYQLSILPYLKENYIVITDRYVFSTFAYAKARGVDLIWAMEINKYLPLPDFTFLLDVEPMEALRRMDQRKRKTMEECSLDFQEALRKEYLRHSWGDKGYYILNGAKEKAQITEEMLHIINSTKGLE